MALKIIGFIFAISLAFGIYNSTQIKDIPFDVNEVIQKANQPHFNSNRIQNSKYIDLKQDEFLVDTNIVYIPDRYSQEYPAIAFDGINYLVVWADSRNGTWDILGTRINQSGIVLDPIGIQISTAQNHQQYPSVAFDGTNYLVVWRDQRNGSAADIYGARVSQDGEVLNRNGIAISRETGWQHSPSLAFDGTNYLIVWVDERSGTSDIYGARLNQDGNVLDTNGIAISTASNEQYFPSVAFDGTNYLVVWQDLRSGVDIFGARITTAGLVLEPYGIAISVAANWQLSPSVSFDGINYFVVWQDQRSGSSDIYGSRVNQSGVVLDPDGIDISTAIDDQGYPSIVYDWNDSLYFIVWDDERNGDADIYGARVNPTGGVLDTNGIAISTPADTQWYPSVVIGGNNYLVTWQDGRGYSHDIYCSRLTHSGIVLDTNGIAISTTVNNQYSPDVAFDGTNYLVVWQDWRNGYDYDIYGCRLDHSGVILDSSAIAISIVANSQARPSVAFDGTNYFAVWEDYRNNFNYDIYGTRITQLGVVIDTNGIPISAAEDQQYHPSITFDGNNFFVVWQDNRLGQPPYYYYDIFGTRVNQSGVILDTNGIQISPVEGHEWYPCVTFDGSNYLVVWEVGSSNIYGARVNQMGLLLDTICIPISTADGQQRFPSIDFDGINYFVFWQDSRNLNFDIFCARVHPSGIVIDPDGIPISTSPDRQEHPAVIFNGANHFVVWEEYQSGDTSDIYGAIVNSSGIVIDSFPISLQTGSQLNPKLAWATGYPALIIYSGWTDSINGHHANAMRIWGKFYPFIGIEEDLKVKMQSAKLFAVYPNPAKNELCVHVPLTFFLSHQWGEDRRRGIKIFDVSGKLVKKEKVTSAQEHKQEMKISLKGINPGIYFLRLGKETKKFLVVK